MGDIPDRQSVDRIIQEVLQGKDPSKVAIREIADLASLIQQETGVQMSRLDMGIPGLDEPEIMREAYIESIRKGLQSKYPHFNGISSLREASQAYVKAYFGIDIPAESHIATNGAMQGGNLLIRLNKLLDGGRKTKVLFLTPVFEVNLRQARRWGVEYELLELESRPKKTNNLSRILADAIEERVSRGDIASVFWSSPSNPAWFILEDKLYKEMAEIADKYGVLLIHDAAYGPMDFRKNFAKGNELIDSPLKYTKNAVLLLSASKMLSFAGARVGLTVAHPELIQSTCAAGGNTVFVEFVQNGLYTETAGVNHNAQYAFARMLESASAGNFDIQNYCRPYEERGRRIMAMFKDTGFEVLYGADNLAGGFYFAASMPGMTTTEMLFKLLRCGISTVPLNTFGVDVDGLRVCCSLPKTHDNDTTTAEQKLQLLEERLKYFAENYK